jgi:hypothetical protein
MRNIPYPNHSRCALITERERHAQIGAGASIQAFAGELPAAGAS